MQEYGWLEWSKLPEMLEVVVPSGDARKVRLLACAFARFVAGVMPDPRSTAALDAAEGFADHQLNKQQLKQILRDAESVAADWEGTVFQDKQ
jgi:hypothetical protein